MDAKGKRVVITGGTSGLGQAAALDFARSGAQVTIVGRDAGRASETQAQARYLGSEVEVILGDVSTRSGVEEVARAVLSKSSSLDVLVNNAGGTFRKLGKTVDGVESTFALNTLSAFLLERALHGALAATRGRVVNLATGFLDQFPVDMDRLSPKVFIPMVQYARTKTAVVLMTVEQAKRYEGEGVSVVALHPGIIMGTRFNGGQPRAVQAIFGPLMRGVGLACTLEEAVRRYRVAAFGDIPSGCYLVNGAPVRLPKQANDEAAKARVFSFLETFT
jgi:NAD(P)-dependent dehydrogenase (short-subunit alcohol dehydrogenase family)